MDPVYLTNKDDVEGDGELGEGNRIPDCEDEKEGRPYKIQEQSDVIAILTLVEQSMKNDNLEDVEYWIRQLQIESMIRENSDQIIAHFLSLAHDLNIPDACPVIMNIWADNNLDMETTYPTSTTLFLNTHLNNEVLKFTMNILGIEYWEVALSLILYDSTVDMEFAVERMEEIYGPQTPSIYQSCIDGCIEIQRKALYTNHHLLDIMQIKYSEVSDFASMPSWLISVNINGEVIRPYDPFWETEGSGKGKEKEEAIGPYMSLDIGDNEDNKYRTDVADLYGAGTKIPVIPLHTELIDSIKNQPGGKIAEVLPSDEEIVDRIMKLTDVQLNTKLPDRAVRDRLIGTLANMSITQKIEMLAPHMETITTTESKSYEREAFRIAGPPNPSPKDQDSSYTGDPCSKYGGHPMFTCFEFHNNENMFNGFIEDIAYTQEWSLVIWYSGKCDACGKRIRQKHHAVRMPMISGGWVGCYCGWECVKEDIPPENVLQMDLVEEYRSRTEEYGIYDRTWTEKAKVSRVKYEHIEDILEASRIHEPSIVQNYGPGSAFLFADMDIKDIPHTYNPTGLVEDFISIPLKKLESESGETLNISGKLESFDSSPPLSKDGISKGMVDEMERLTTLSMPESSVKRRGV